MYNTLVALLLLSDMSFRPAPQVSLLGAYLDVKSRTETVGFLREGMRTGVSYGPAEINVGMSRSDVTVTSESDVKGRGAYLNYWVATADMSAYFPIYENLFGSFYGSYERTAIPGYPASVRVSYKGVDVTSFVKLDNLEFRSLIATLETGPGVLWGRTFFAAHVGAVYTDLSLRVSARVLTENICVNVGLNQWSPVATFVLGHAFVGGMRLSLNGFWLPLHDGSASGATLTVGYNFSTLIYENAKAEESAQKGQGVTKSMTAGFPLTREGGSQ